MLFSERGARCGRPALPAAAACRPVSLGPPGGAGSALRRPRRVKLHASAGTQHTTHGQMWTTNVEYIRWSTAAQIWCHAQNPRSTPASTPRSTQGQNQRLVSYRSHAADFGRYCRQPWPDPDRAWPLSAQSRPSAARIRPNKADSGQNFIGITPTSVSLVHISLDSQATCGRTRAATIAQFVLEYKPNLCAEFGRRSGTPPAPEAPTSARTQHSTHVWYSFDKIWPETDQFRPDLAQTRPKSARIGQLRSPLARNRHT